LRSKLNWTIRIVASALFMLALSAAAAQAQTTARATWDPNNDGTTVGYRLYYGTASGSYQWSIDAGNQVSAPVNLSPGSIYYFVVRGYNQQYQEGPPSSEATIDLRGGGGGSAAPTAQISATLQGSTATVTWQTTNATSASINGTTVGLSGSASVTVQSGTTFTLTARAADGRTATASTTVTPGATSGGPSAQITASLNGTTANVSWQTSDATSIWITVNGAYYAVGPSGSAGVPVSGPTTFTLNARSADGRIATANATVTPGAANGAPTAQITATLDGATAIVNWQTTNATSVWITVNGAYYAVGASGSAGVPVSGPTTFTLNARSADGQTTSANATVAGGSSGAPTAQITAALDGATAIVAWQTTNATSVWITVDGAYYAVGPSGSAGVPVSGSTTFTLNARSADGRTATAVASVTRRASSGPTAQISTRQEGTTTVVTWQTTNATSVWITANGAYYSVGASGTAGVQLSSATTLVLHAQAADGQTETATVTATP
jgi:hypothetical protein